MNLLYQFSPLFVVLAVPLLAWLLVIGRRDPLRAARLVSLAAVAGLLVELAITLSYLLLPSQWGLNVIAIQVLSVVARITAAATLLSYAAWTLLLADAARDGVRTRLVVLAIVFTLALLLQTGLVYREPLFLAQLREVLQHLGWWGSMLQRALDEVSVIAALVAAFVSPSSQAPVSTMSGSTETTLP